MVLVDARLPDLSNRTDPTDPTAHGARKRSATVVPGKHSTHVIPSERSTHVIPSERSTHVIPSERSDRGICVEARTAVANGSDVTYFDVEVRNTQKQPMRVRVEARFLRRYATSE